MEWKIRLLEISLGRHTGKNGLRKVSEQEAREPKHFIVEGIYSRVKDGTRIAVQVTYPEGLDLVDVWPPINSALEQNHWMRVD